MVAAELRRDINIAFNYIVAAVPPRSGFSAINLICEGLSLEVNLDYLYGR